MHDGIPIFIYDDLSSWVVQFHAIGNTALHSDADADWSLLTGAAVVSNSLRSHMANGPNGTELRLRTPTKIIFAVPFKRDFVR